MTINSTDIEDQARSPKRITTDEGTVEERDVSQLIDAQKHNAAQSAASSPLFGLTLARFKPAGAV